jgi:hypothetical protein
VRGRANSQQWARRAKPIENIRASACPTPKREYNFAGIGKRFAFALRNRILPKGSQIKE